MKRTLIVPIAASLLISACGGSSGSAPIVSPDPSLAITSVNASEVAIIAYQAAIETQELGDGDGIFIGSAQGGIAKVDGNLATSLKSTNSGSQVPIPAETVDCFVSGTETFSGEIADPITPTLTVGDFFQFEYAACDDGFDEITDGIVRTDIDAFSGDFLSDQFSMTITLTLTNFQVSLFENQSLTATDVVLSNGGATLALDATDSPFVSININGESLVVDSNDGSESLTNFASAFTVDGNLVPAPYTTSASGTLDSTRLAGVIRYSNPETFMGRGADYPSSGEFLVEGLGSTLLLIADDSVNVRILIDLGADGTIDETIVTTWAALATIADPGPG